MVKNIGFLPYSPNSKVKCPQCGRSKSLTLFQNLENMEVYPPGFGVCDRVQKCGYNRWPCSQSPSVPVKITPEPVKPVDHLDMSEVESRMANKGRNNFFEWLGDLIGMDALKKLKMQYKLGTSLNHSGFVSFPQIDAQGNLRQIQEVLYDPKTGKRNKKKGSQRWAFEKWKYPNLNLTQCYGGLHLIKGNDKPIAVVESFKTAVICSHFISSYNWVSTTSLGMLTNERCKSLNGRTLILFPDLGAEEIWRNKANYLKGMKSISVSDYLEKNANKFNLEQGSDIADLVIKSLNN